MLTIRIIEYDYLKSTLASQYYIYDLNTQKVFLKMTGFITVSLLQGCIFSLFSVHQYDLTMREFL